MKFENKRKNENAAAETNEFDEVNYSEMTTVFLIDTVTHLF